MAAQWFVSFHENVSLSSDDGRELHLNTPLGEVPLKTLTPEYHTLLQRLTPPGEQMDRLAREAPHTGVPHAVARFMHVLRKLARRGFVILSVRHEGQPLVTLEPISETFQWPRGDATGGRFLLSRFACLHRVEERSVLESPLSSARFVVHDERVVRLVFALHAPLDTDDLSRCVPDLPTDVCRQLVGLLDSASLVSRVDAEGQSEESRRPELQCWEFHDLLFHARSRGGRHDAPMGATYRGAGTVSDRRPPPAVKQRPWTEGIELHVPELESLCRDDSPLAEVMERRQSIREYGEPPISRRQLGEFLYRVARIREQTALDVETPAGMLWMDVTSRPYPSGGGLYELEIYPVVRQATELEAGMYYYDAARHVLQRVSGWNGSVEGLVRKAGFAADIPYEELQIVLCISARFDRVAWKYSSIAYALVLKHVGVMYQSMYLAATAMGLAPCALGSGDSDLFATAAGSNYYEESSVGEFLLGSRREH